MKTPVRAYKGINAGFDSDARTFSVVRCLVALSHICHCLISSLPGGVVGRLIIDRMGVLESELYELVVISIRQASKVIKSWLLDQRLQLQQ